MLIATDLDGTLVPADSSEPSPFTASVLERADRADIPLVFVTARPLRWMDGFWPLVGEHGLAIVSNGAVVYDVHAGSAISVRGIEPAAGLSVISAIAASVPGAAFAVECIDGIRLDPRFVERHHVPEGSPRGELDEIWDLPALKVLVRHPSMGPDDFRDAVVAAVGETATATWSESGLVEISAAGVDKATALVELCARLGVAADDVVAFGDMPNDIPMLAWAGTSYAMADAHPSVLEAADHVAPPCGDDGVARVIEALLDR
ncbi:HAD family hydrolase [Nocardioides antri]|uniref:HAD family hydrolase n=1 Tax=Nocardioides antri TaxID=2607659 RepID=A0A5B1M447_9ACTN|nr:HAD family hydrolase [Nocardioides antri]KAA1426520.1 HAD family hydrolase [Nocardioides antri]